MSTIKEKLKAVASALIAIEKQFGKGAIMSLGGEVEDIAVIPTGSVGLDCFGSRRASPGSRG